MLIIVNNILINKIHVNSNLIINIHFKNFNRLRMIDANWRHQSACDDANWRQWRRMVDKHCASSLIIAATATTSGLWLALDHRR